jgi:nicotinamidase-related amidase
MKLMIKCLLIVDVQKGFINEHTKEIPSAVSALQADYDFVFASRFINLPDSNFRKLMNWKRFNPGSEETALAFDPQPNAVVFDKSA